MYKSLYTFYLSIPRWARNKYFLAAVFFAVWMLFFDSQDLFTQYKRRKQISALETQIDFYKQQINQVNTDKEALFGNIHNLEKFSREHYRMKRDNEDLFVISNK